MQKILRVFLFLFLAPGLLFAQDPVSDYALAQKCYHSLDKTSPKGWKGCLHKFETVLKKYPGTVHAKKALFSMARLSQERFEISQEVADIDRAFASYNRFLREYPKDSLADDSLFQIARMRIENQKDGAKGQRALEAILERYPGGDMGEAALKKLEKVKNGTTEQQETSGDFTIRTLVIDPGHGGNDPGAKGLAGTKEAEVSLQIARKLAFHLKKKLGLNVLLTRTNNRDVSLAERNRLANNKKADLFISIHANANPSRSASGVQTFYLNNATSSAGRQLAERENKEAGKKLSLTETILTTMLQNANTVESRDLAASVQKMLVGRLRKNYSNVEDLKVETALFDVLIGAKCPSILVETSFITHPLEEKRLKDAKYQWALAEGIAKGVETYITARKQLAASSL